MTNTPDDVQTASRPLIGGPALAPSRRRRRTSSSLVRSVCVDGGSATTATPLPSGDQLTCGATDGTLVRRVTPPSRSMSTATSWNADAPLPRLSTVRRRSPLGDHWGRTGGRRGEWTLAAPARSRRGLPSAAIDHTFPPRENAKRAPGTSTL